MAVFIKMFTDASDMAKSLSGLGFEVIIKTDLNFKKLISAINDFTDKLQDYEVGLFYYSGHGIGFQGDNYLVPTDCNITYEHQMGWKLV
jgi:uncharacterized caspase-like protein